MCNNVETEMTNFQDKIFNKHPVKLNKERSDIILHSLIEDIILENNTKSLIKILDIGCGGGQLLEEFVKKSNIVVYGVDISRNPLKIAREKGYKCLLCNVENNNLPFKDKMFNIIILNDLLEHIINPDILLTEVYRTLKDEGNLIICIPNISQPISWFIQIFLDLPPIQSARYKSVHVRDYTLRILKIVLRLNGFKINQVVGTYLYPFDNKIGRLIARLFPRISEKIIIKCEKGVIPNLLKEDVFFNTKALLELNERI